MRSVNDSSRTSDIVRPSRVFPEGRTSPLWFQDAVNHSGESHQLVVEGCPIVYRSWGDGKHLVVLIHGRAANTHWWDHIAPLLAADRRVVSLDLSGHGDSGRRARYGLDIWAREAALVIDAERSRAARIPPRGTSPVGDQQGLGSVTVVGHSMGSIVGLKLAAGDDVGLSAVVAIDSPVGVPPEAGEHTAPAERRYPTRTEAESRFRLRRADPANVDFIIQHLAHHAVRQLPDGAWTWKTDPLAMVPELVEPSDLGAISVPTLLVRAERGMATDESSALLGALVSASVKTATIPDSGHHVPVDQPRRLTAVLASFIDGITR